MPEIALLAVRAYGDPLGESTVRVVVGVCTLITQTADRNANTAAPMD
ncbi:MAG: hypothetical protein KJ638_07500 [Chloroflexi bacterium]|nr:hypothetical protein [Chloroflexota bacterium]